jgi:hypothetical protein
MNADSQEMTLACKRVVAIPTTYFAVIGWTPTDVDFTDPETGRTESFRVEGLTALRSGALKMAISG